MIKGIHKVLVAIVLAIYSLIFFLILAVSGLCADTSSCGGGITLLQIGLSGYAVGQWVLYFYALKHNKSQILTLLTALPLTILVIYAVLANTISTP